MNKLEQCAVTKLYPRSKGNSKYKFGATRQTPIKIKPLKLKPKAELDDILRNLLLDNHSDPLLTLKVLVDVYTAEEIYAGIIVPFLDRKRQKYSTFSNEEVLLRLECIKPVVKKYIPSMKLS